ncbi:hypothetical protein F511_36067 [Dorcoceras hygrometricum]|uniref:Uncharacterized protein n=1 Tax=Dorcoceras hygrometricum TaxID=472368 RepID=A0A2Z7BEX1_9LAMI|nr:hypothetical protein F511_36067 [Dorcoceras hygrometricum]
MHNVRRMAARRRLPLRKHVRDGRDPRTARQAPPPRPCASPEAYGRPPSGHRAASTRFDSGHRAGSARWRLAPTSFTRKPAAVDRQSGPRPEARIIRHPALEGLKNSTRTEFPHRGDRKKFDHVNGGTRQRHGAADWGVWERREAARDTASRGPTTIVTPKSQFRTDPSDHDSIGYPRIKASGESSTTKHRLLHASGPHPIPPPNDPKSEIRRLCQQTTQGRCLRTPHQLQANVRKQYPNEASQQEETNATTLAFVGASYHRKSKKIRILSTKSINSKTRVQGNWGNKYKQLLEIKQLLLKQMRPLMLLDHLLACLPRSRRHLRNTKRPRPVEKPGKPGNNTQATNTSPRGTSGSNPSMESSNKQHKENMDKYANAMQEIKATTESREPKDRNNCSTARSDQRTNNRFVATGILSTWELPTHLQYTIPDANNQLHLLLLTNEMWELPTPLIATNKPSREMRYGSYPLASKVYWNYPLVLEHSILELNLPQKARSEIRRLCQQTTQGRCLRTPHQLQANVRKQYPNEASQQEESNATILTFVEAAYRGKSKKIRAFKISTLLATRAWLRPVSRGNRDFTIDCGRLRQSGPRPDTRLLRQPALEGLTRSARTDSPRQVGRNNFPATQGGGGTRAAAAAAYERREGAAAKLSIRVRRVKCSYK